jgi:hypothetical protein
VHLYMWAREATISAAQPSPQPSVSIALCHQQHPHTPAACAMQVITPNGVQAAAAVGTHVPQHDGCHNYGSSSADRASHGDTARPPAAARHAAACRRREAVFISACGGREAHVVAQPPHTHVQHHPHHRVSSAARTRPSWCALNNQVGDVGNGDANGRRGETPRE